MSRFLVIFNISKFFNKYEYLFHTLHIYNIRQGYWANQLYPALLTVINMYGSAFKGHRIPENEHKKPIIDRVYAPMVIGCTKYKQNPLNIVGCRVVTRAGWTDRRRKARQYPMAQIG